MATEPMILTVSDFLTLSARKRKEIAEWGASVLEPIGRHWDDVSSVIRVDDAAGIVSFDMLDKSGETWRWEIITLRGVQPCPRWWQTGGRKKTGGALAVLPTGD
jgi:hypothetical protein